jgi:hypothetical protein
MRSPGLSVQRALRSVLARVALAALLAHAGAAWAYFSPSQSSASAVHARAASSTNQANRKDAAPGAGRSVTRRPAAKTAPARASAPVITATGPGPGQSGYVHYFVIDTPDGEHETQIGIEMPDGMIAWSFPELGVVVSPFISSGEMTVNGRRYAVKHLYGIRPFPDNASMRALQKDLVNRVVLWVDDGTPYCNTTARSNELCHSCLGFVMRILYPSRAGFLVDLPRDFMGASSGMYITTEDLLLYHAGLHDNRSRQGKLNRIERLAIPQRLRDDLIELVNAMEPDTTGGSVAADTKKKDPGKKRAGTRPDTRIR